MRRVLDHGYVRLVDSMGTDLSCVNAARVSYDKESPEMSEKDERLLRFLIRENHTAPFRHAIVSFECYAPLMVKNQWFKHLIGGIYTEDQEFPGLDPYFAWNESSRRYVTEEEQFYVPESDMWRSKPENSKQGSGSNVSVMQGFNLTGNLRDYIKFGVKQYQEAMEAGIAPEQARLFIPAYALYVRWRWTTSLQGAMHFINLRNKPDAQYEIQEYAKAVKTLTAGPFPASMAAMEGTL